MERRYKRLSKNVRNFVVKPNIDEISITEDNHLDSDQIYRHYVSQNIPVLLRGATSHWPAMKKWSKDYFAKMECDVSVSVTPDGYADAIRTNGENERVFALPYETRMKFSEVVQILNSCDVDDDDQPNAVYYVQKQNSNLSDPCELGSSLSQDIIEPEFARLAFGCEPDAINFWMGDKRAVTSLHKDPYENLYAVIHGHKDIILFPPTDIPFLKREKVRVSQYVLREKGSPNCDTPVIGDPNLDIIKSQELELKYTSPLQTVSWITTDPLANDEFDKMRSDKFRNSIRVRVEAGDLLYLPSLWFHHLTQSHGCVAVNFWYDMKFDFRYCYFQFLSSLNTDDSSVSESDDTDSSDTE